MVLAGVAQDFVLSLDLIFCKKKMRGGVYSRPTNHRCRIIYLLPFTRAQHSAQYREFVYRLILQVNSYEAPRYTKRAKGSAEQHYRDAAIRNTGGGALEQIDTGDPAEPIRSLAGLRKCV
jgi:hypothetical protein